MSFSYKKEETKWKPRDVVNICQTQCMHSTCTANHSLSIHHLCIMREDSCPQSLSTYSTNLSNDLLLSRRCPLLGYGKWCVHYVEILNTNLTVSLWGIDRRLGIFIISRHFHIINTPINLLHSHSCMWSVGPEWVLRPSVFSLHLLHHFLACGSRCGEILLQLIQLSSIATQAQRGKKSDSISVSHCQTVLVWFIHAKKQERTTHIFCFCEMQQTGKNICQHNNTCGFHDSRVFWWLISAWGWEA